MSKEDKPEEGFLSRWARRKQAVQQEAIKPKVAPPEMEESGAQALAAPSGAEPLADEPAKALTDEDMPPLESLDETSNLSAFFSEKVSEELRRQALRKLFHLPKYNITDGLNEYDGDYRTFTQLGDVVTAEMRHRLEIEKQRMEEKAKALLAEEEQKSASAEPSVEPAEAVDELNSEVLNNGDSAIPEMTAKTNPDV